MGSAVKLRALVEHLDRELALSDFSDSSNNGLQVGDLDREVSTVCCGVDASREFFDAAAERSADLLICHHGLSWGDSLKYITDLNFCRISALVREDMALYAAHLPLDAHPNLGNNVLIARALGLTRLRRFGEYKGQVIGYEGRLPEALSRDAFKALVRERVGSRLQCMDFGPGTVHRVAVVSGGAAEEVAEAGRKGIDVFLSGEPALVAYSLAQEYGVNAVFAGHYATEVFGVRALAEHLATRFGLQAAFIDLGVPF